MCLLGLPQTDLRQRQDVLRLRDQRIHIDGLEEKTERADRGRPCPNGGRSEIRDQDRRHITAGLSEHVQPVDLW